MSQIKVTDEWLYQYMPLADEAMIHEIEKQVDSHYRFSNQFCRKMDKTIRYEKTIQMRRSFTRIGRRVAIILLVILSSTFLVTMSVKAYRV